MPGEIEGNLISLIHLSCWSIFIGVDVFASRTAGSARERLKCCCLPLPEQINMDQVQEFLTPAPCRCELLALPSSTDKPNYPRPFLLVRVFATTDSFCDDVQKAVPACNVNHTAVDYVLVSPPPKSDRFHRHFSYRQSRNISIRFQFGRWKVQRLVSKHVRL